MNDSLVEGLPVLELPEIGSVVDDLRKRMPKV